jgi:ectoine hydroxylase-related dioxygenase (phytanoyl-CoA dioxygenase family)
VQVTLPSPTSDLDRCRLELDEHGYCLHTAALPVDGVRRLRRRVEEQAMGEAAIGRAVDREGGANQRIWMLLNKGRCFQDLLQHPAINRLVAHLLDEPFLLSSITANIVAPGDEPLALHSDQGFVPRPWPTYPLTANVVWLLDEFHDDNGATRVVPGSHRDAPAPDPAAMLARARLLRNGGLPVRAPAGTALVMDGRLVHGTGRNATARSRYGILTYFCRPFVRQQENFALSTAPEVLAAIPDDVRALLGLRVWKTLGSVDGAGDGAIVGPSMTLTGALDRDGYPAAADAETTSA